MDIVPSVSPLHLIVALKDFGVFLLPFSGQEKLSASPLCLELSCEIITLGYLCVPTPTFYMCNSGVTVEQKGFSQAVPKMQALFHFFIISGLCYFILMCTIYGILKVFSYFIHWPK